MFLSVSIWHKMMPLEYLLQQHWTTMMDGLIYSVSFVRFSIHTIETRYIFCDFFYRLISPRLEKKVDVKWASKDWKMPNISAFICIFFPHSVANRAKHFQFLQNSTPKRNIQNIEFHIFFFLLKINAKPSWYFQPREF